MKYFLDTEFHEYKNNGINTIELISIGIICEDGRKYYAESDDVNLSAAEANTWLKENVLANLVNNEKLSNDSIAATIRGWIGTDKPIFYGYYCDYDWVVFCWLFGRMIDLPENFPMYCIDLKQMMDERGLTKEWKQKYCPDPINEHNALADAKWNKRLYDAIGTYEPIFKPQP